MLDTSGQEVAKQSYLPYGEAWGVSATELPTTFTYTGQREAAEIGLMYYVARWYDTEIGHFIQADTIIPDAGNPLSWNRYAYVKYNPMTYIDPSGETDIVNQNNGNGVFADSHSGIRIAFVVDLGDVVVRDQLSKEYTDKYETASCGLFAISSAGFPLENISKELAERYRYDGKKGIQPSYLTDLAGFLYGNGNVNAYNNSSFFEIVKALDAGLAVIVDILVDKDAQGRYFVTNGEGGTTVAHFAWVIGVDLTANKIYLEDTLNGGDKGYWAVDIDIFIASWTYPEKRAGKEGNNPEDVNHWMMTIIPMKAFSKK